MLTAAVSFRLLGSFEIRHKDEIVALNGKPRSLLAALLLKSGQRVSTDYLIEVVWGTSPPRNPRASLYSYVMRARRALTEAGLSSEQLYNTNDGYGLNIGTADLDVTRFNRYRTQAADARNDGDEQGELASLRFALGLWRGSALQDIPSDLLQRGPAQQLEEARLAVLQRRIELDLGAARYDDILPTLLDLTSAYPARESFWRQLMLAQYRAKRRGEALETYRRAASFLRGELGIDPSAEIERLHEAILNDRDGEYPPQERQNASCRPALAETSDQGGSSTAICLLPRDVPDFVGRHRTLDTMLDVLRPNPGGFAPSIVALSGPPGIGKSTLAIHAAHLLRREFPDGQLYARLGSTPTSSVQTFLRGLRSIGATGDELSLRTPDLAAILRDTLADRRVLLVLDDVPDPEQLEPLLPGTSSCAVIAVSRGVLATLPGARHLRVGPMADSETADLLRSIIGRSRFDDQPGAAHKLAQLCQGNAMLVRDVSAFLLIHDELSIQWLADAATKRDIARIIGPEIQFHHAIRHSFEVLAPLTQTTLRKIASLDGTCVTASTLDLLADGNSGRVSKDLLAAGLAHSTYVTGGEPAYQLNEWLLGYLQQQQPD